MFYFENLPVKDLNRVLNPIVIQTFGLYVQYYEVDLQFEWFLLTQKL